MCWRSLLSLAEGTDIPMSLPRPPSAWGGWEGQGCDGGTVPSLCAPKGEYFCVCRQPMGHWSPFQLSAVLSSPSKTLVLELFPPKSYLRNRRVGQEGMKLGVAGSSQKQLEVFLPAGAELWGEEDQVLWFPWAGCPCPPPAMCTGWELGLWAASSRSSWAGQSDLLEQAGKGRFVLQFCPLR